MTTPLDALISALHDAGSYNAAAEARPEAVLWCDANHEFAPLLPALRERLPELLTYGEFDLAARIGPAVWLRAAVAGAVGAVTLPAETTPIIYLPGVGREILKGAEDCPQLLQPLVWYTASGTLFGHVNGKDWTLRGFLASERGTLRLAIADDMVTRAALGAAALRFCTRPVEELRAKSWDADQLNALLAPDLNADMLDWIDGTFSAEADASRFNAFAAIAQKQLKFDPRRLTRQDAARRLAKRQGKWGEVWKRFSNSTGYVGVVELLGFEEPEPGNLFDHAENRDAYPKLNAQGETKLRNALMATADLALDEARERIAGLDAEHGWRRETVWARRGAAPLAQAVRLLARVAAAAALPSHDGEALAEAYAAEGADIDWTAMCALAAAPREVDRAAVAAALRAVYLPWLEDGASKLQDLVGAGKVKLATAAKAKSPTTVLFVDGLRMDVAKELARVLEDDGAKVQLGWAWSGFPTVTATCKPLVTPVAHKLDGPATTNDVYALPLSPEGKPTTKPVLYALMQAEGWETSDTLLPEAKLWAETGRFDEEGHSLQSRLAGALQAAIRDAADDVLKLIRTGRKVRIVTDHGWLLMPGNLPKAELEPGLVEPQGKRARCAMVKPKAQTSYLQVPWTWNPDVLVAAASGARSFIAGCEYAHGGISPQECVLPVMTVEGDKVRPEVSIVKAQWEGFRLRVEVAGGADMRVDLRMGPDSGGPSLISGVRVLDETGRTSFLVKDEHEGATVCLVVMDEADKVHAHRVLTVGGE